MCFFQTTRALNAMNTECRPSVYKKMNKKTKKSASKLWVEGKNILLMANAQAHSIKIPLSTVFNIKLYYSLICLCNWRWSNSELRTKSYIRLCTIKKCFSSRSLLKNIGNLRFFGRSKLQLTLTESPLHLDYNYWILLNVAIEILFKQKIPNARFFCKHFFQNFELLFTFFNFSNHSSIIQLQPEMKRWLKQCFNNFWCDKSVFSKIKNKPL